MDAYRYLEPKHADLWIEEGYIRVGSTTSVAALENGLKDNADGAAALTIGRHSGRIVAGSIEDQTLQRFGMNLAGTNLVMINSGATQHVHGYMICMSLDPNNQHIRDESPLATSTLRIRDIEALKEAVTPLLPQEHLADRGEWAKVRYLPRQAFSLADTMRADPFVKAERFKPESEVRLFWRTTRSVAPVCIKSPAIAACVEHT